MKCKQEETRLTSEQLNLVLAAIKDGTINIADVQDQEEVKRREEILAQHPYAIWYSESEHVWYTHLPDPVKGRTKHKRSTREGIEDLIVDFYEHCEEKVTVKEAFDRWNDSRAEKGIVKKATRDRYTQVFNRHFQKIQEQYISDISPLFWEKLLQEELDTHALTQEAWKALKLDFKGMITYARREGLVDYKPEDILYNIDADKRKFDENLKSDQEDAFSIEEWYQIIDFIIEEEHPSNHHLGLLLMAVTGLRVGELCTLQFSDIEEGIIKIQRTETRYKDENGKETISIDPAPKTKAGERPVPIPKDYMWIIDEMKKRNPDSPFIFMYRGKRIKGKGFRNQLYKLCDVLKFERRKSPHKMRKTYASILIDDKVPDADIIKIMGHIKFETTQKHYHRDIGNHTEEKLASVVDGLPEFQRRDSEQSESNNLFRIV